MTCGSCRLYVRHCGSVAVQRRLGSRCGLNPQDGHVRDFAHQGKFARAETFAAFPGIAFLVEAVDGDAVPSSRLLAFVLPYRRLDAAESQFMNWLSFFLFH